MGGGDRRLSRDMKTEEVSLLLRALCFAASRHRNQRRKDQEASPYINHLIDVAQILWEIGRIRDVGTLVAGILHDAIEDTDTSPEDLEAEFGASVRSIVEEVSDDKRLPKQERKRLQVEHAGSCSVPARQIKLADKISNVQDMIDSPPTRWPLERCLEYVDWAEEVVNGLRGTNPALERCFDDLCGRVRQKLATGASR
jgi:guanosine-3',5'-bis(diphosphate) 3'-pyrophosphohydrolase